jgi:hypothetical protein
VVRIWSTHGDEKFIPQFQEETLKERDRLEDGRKLEYNIKSDLREIRCEGVDWIQDTGQWRALVDTVLGLRVQ